MDKIQKTIDYLRNQGRFGDTDLVHVNPEEKAMLKAMGGSGTINPNTGLEEYFRLSSLNPVKIIKKVGSAVDDVVHEIPGGWKTVAAVTGATMGLPTDFGLTEAGTTAALDEAGTQAALDLASKEALAGYGAADATTGAVLNAAADAGIPLSEEAINSYLMEAAPVEYGANTWTGPVTDAELAQGLPSSTSVTDAAKAANLLKNMVASKIAGSPVSNVGQGYAQRNPFFTPKELQTVTKTKENQPAYLGQLAELLRG